MNETNEKKITILNVYKVIMIIFSCALIGLVASTIYGWVTGAFEINYIILALCAAVYCCTAAEYEALKKIAKKNKS